MDLVDLCLYWAQVGQFALCQRVLQVLTLVLQVLALLL